jgi:thioesterase domain-containing protein
MAGLGLGWELRDLPAYLGPDQPLYGLRPTPFLDEPGLWGTRQIATRYVRALRAVRPEGPYLLGGGCAAGLVAFEMACQLTAMGESVPLVALFDVDFPPPRWLPGLLGVWLLRLPRQWARFRSLGPGERSGFLRRWAGVWAARIRQRLRRRAPGPGAGAELEARLAPLRDVAWRYRPQPWNGRIAALLPADSLTWPDRDRRLDWRRMARGGWEVRAIPGVHEDALLEAHSAAAAEVLKGCIERALDPRAGDRP